MINLRRRELPLKILSILQKKEILFLGIICLLFIIVRSINFSYHLNFTADQGEQATTVYKIWRDKDVVLVGNPLSIRYQEHFLFQGPAYYYMMLPIMLLANWDPITSSYVFMLFCAFTLVPLYFGVKKLINTDAARAVSIIYALLPYFINYTRFHWNPNYQLALIPFLILLMGLYKEKKDPRYFFGLSFMLGLLLQFHYMFILVVMGLLIYYFILKKERFSKILIFIIGGAVGFLPLILNEFVHNFYSVRTIILFLNHRNELSFSGQFITPHYWLGIFTFVLILFLAIADKFLLKKITFNNRASRIKPLFFLVLSASMLTWSLFLFVPKPTTSYWSNAKNWNYLGEYKAYEIIKKENLTNYNIANFVYFDTISPVIKYLLIKDGVPIEHQDYYKNKYLFVLNRSSGDFSWITSYEFSAFSPRKLLKTWKLNDYFNLYLFERLPVNS